MAYVIQNALLGAQPIDQASDTAQHTLGTVVRANDPVYGGGEFIYLKGLDSTAVGEWVTINNDDYSTALLAANAIGPVGVSMSVCVTGQFGWYQIKGKAVGLAASGYVNDALVFSTATAGTVDDTVVDGDMVHLAKGASAVDTPSTGLAEFEINYPYTDDIATND
jgi:hypothetical protein